MSTSTATKQGAKKSVIKSQTIATAQGGIIEHKKTKQQKDEQPTIREMKLFPTYGTSLFENKDSDIDNMLEKHGLNWNVSKIQGGFLHPETGEFVQAEDYFFTVRDDKMKALGICNKKYVVGQNTDLINIIRTVMEKGDLKIAFADELNGGKLVYVGLEMPEHYEIHGEKMKSYIVAGTSHDRSKKTFFGVSNVSVVCENTFFTIANEVAIKIAHTKNREDHLQKASDVHSLINKLQRQLKMIFNEFGKKEVNDATVKKIVQHTLNINSKEEISTRKSNMSNALMEAISFAMSSKTTRGNLWGTWNGITLFYNHYNQDINDPQARREDIMLGGSNSSMQRSFEFHKQLCDIRD